MTDKRQDRERLQAEALKANLRRRKSQARTRKEADAVKADNAENQPGTGPGHAGR